ncbi:MAG: DUF6531 domain-containing protein, partial [Nitrospirota bacterium]
MGQSNSRHYVNLATGNLVLQDVDETILTRGLPISMLRTYNSQGTVAGQGQDGWLSAFERRVGAPTGTANTSGSTITRYLGDGSQALFVYDVARGRYISSTGDGMHEEIVWSTASNYAFWTDFNAKQREQYDSTGKLTLIQSLETGVGYTLTYDNAGRIFSVVSNVSANGDGLFFAYDDTSGRLIGLVSREGGQTLGQVWYDYDTLGRLSAVTTDLTPDLATVDEVAKTVTLPSRADANAWNGVSLASNDGKLFRTRYTYESATDASNLRIAAVDFSDGTVLSIEYTAGKVSKTIVGTAGNGAQVTEYAYDVEGPSTGLSWVEVKDGSERRWQYGFDASSHQLAMIVSPQIGGLSDATTYSYDADGNVVQVRVERGSTLLSRIDYQYDGLGNVVKEWDLLGNRIDRTYNTFGAVLTETRYSAPDPDGAGGSANPAAGSGMTVRYVYSGMRLIYVVGATGEVTEYVYGTGSEATGGLGARFQPISKKRYVSYAYDTTALAVGDAIDNNAIYNWTLDKQASIERVDYRYDTQGRLQETREYAQVAQTASAGVAVGDGVLDASTSITRYTYDAQGLLRQQITQRGAGRTLGATTPQTTSEIVDYVYDGMGRLLSSLKRSGATPAMPDPTTQAAAYADWLAANDANTVLTTWTYLDSGNTIKVISDTGMTRTEVRNAAGMLVAVTEADAPSAPMSTRTAERKYDAAGRLVAEEDANGARRYFIYDLKGRLSATIDATGAVIETVYDGMDRAIETRRYANRVTPQESWWTGSPPTVLWRSDAGTPPGNALVVTVDATRDQIVQASYDGAGRLSMETVVGADASQTRTTAYIYDAADRLLRVNVTDGAGTTATERSTRYLYDKANRRIAEVDALGHVTEFNYDLAGRVIKTIRYAQPTSNPDATDLASLKASIGMSGAEIVNRHFYDGRGNLIGTLDAEGYLTEYVYDEAANQRAVLRYANKPTTTDTDEWMIILRGDRRGLEILRGHAVAGLPSGTGFRTTQRQFNALGQLETELDHEGTVTRYSYDEAGRLVKTSRGDALEQIRDGHLRYDAFGNLTGELSGEGAALLTVGMSQAQIDALYAQYGVRHGYDLLGRRTESVDAQGNKTWYFYDSEGRQTFVVRGVHDAGNVQNAQGEVRQTRYDA